MVTRGGGWREGKLDEDSQKVQTSTYKRSLNGDVGVQVVATELITKAVVRDEIAQGKIIHGEEKRASTEP